MIKSVTVTNERGENLELVLREPEKSGFLITEITGLNPPKSSINSTELVTGDGAVFNSSRIESRNIVLSLKFLPKPTIEHTRELSYKMFPIKHKVRLTFVTELRTCYIDGYVETNEAIIFSSATATQISIVCPQPAFLSPRNDETLYSGTNPSFEFPIDEDDPEYSGIQFPLEYDSDLEDYIYEGLEFSELYQKTILNIEYSGEIDTGMIFYIHFMDTAKNIEIWNYYDPYNRIKIDTDKVAKIIGGPLVIGDDIEIVTIDNQKKATCIHNGQEYNILNSLNKDAAWIQLTMGKNTICYTAEEGLTNIQFRVTNPVLWQGI